MSQTSTRLKEPLICLWQHEQDVDIAPLVKELGFNLVWTDDDAYDGTQKWEDTHMYRVLQVPGVKYVIPKVDRAAWGWTQEIALRHAKWVAELSLKHPEIIGLYLNDFYDEIEDGHRTMEQWREIIAAIRSINSDLDLWVPHYPHRRNENQAYDFDYQGVMMNLWDPSNLEQAEQHLAASEAQHAGKIILGGIYINSGAHHGHWLTEEQFKKTLKIYVDQINAGKLHGLRIYCACQLTQRPEYAKWAKEVLKDLKPSG
ncbi:MAG TPA: hypothetical protein VMY87_06650 [Armatimonadota bacterium]|nr:hypothetical protein [Armatimonadota bacterium]